MPTPKTTTSPRSIEYYAGRVATYLQVIANIAGAAAIVIANTDWTSTAGIIAGLIGANAALQHFRMGAQNHEAQIASPETNVFE